MTAATGATGASGRGRGGWVGVIAAVVVVVVVVVLMTRTRQLAPFMTDSAAPGGYAALTELFEESGADVRGQRASALADADSTAPDVVVVPVPAYANDAELARLRELAEQGATVVLGEPWPLTGAQDDVGELPFEDELIGSGFFAESDRVLADTPAIAVAPGDCDVDGLDDLGPIDGAFAWPFEAPSGAASCYSSVDGVLVSVRGVGDGRIVSLGSPYLWANARLQPAKEAGGTPLANAAMALVVTGAAPGVRIVVVDALPSAGATVEGTEGPIELMPLPVKLALAQLLVVFVLFVWWRSTRLGRPVPEPLPVEIAGSELVVAVGDLLRRKGSPDRAAIALRADTRRVLAERLGAVGASDEVLVQVVAARTGRDPATVATALGSSPVPSSDALVQLARTLDQIRSEVLSVPTPS